jgi:hypothetical protein
MRLATQVEAMSENVTVTSIHSPRPFFSTFGAFFFKKILRMEFSDFHRAIDLDLLNPNVDELLRT